MGKEENFPKRSQGLGGSIKSTMKKGIWICLTCLILGLSGYIYYKYFFVFGRGVKEGQLNYVVYKGTVFKTYEGKLIQAGFRTPKAGAGMVESEKFEFSISDESVAKRLMLASGKSVELSYKEYKGVVPWRGYSVYIVDSIIAINSIDNP